MVAIKHSYTTGPAPQWASVADGSTIIGARVAAVPAPVADGGADAGVTDITWVLLRAASNTGEGILANVTYVQRVDTKGGVGPSGACDTGDAGAARNVGYTARYYFYTGGNSEAGTPDASDSSTSETSTTEASTADSDTEAAAD